MTNESNEELERQRAAREARYEKVRKDFQQRRKADDGFEYFDFGVPYGWLDLVVELDKQLDEVVPGYTILQVKSKFAGLRYYVNPPQPEGYQHPGWKRAQELIAEAEEKSYTICELCGEPGSPTGGGWVWTLCPQHSAERDERNQG